MQQISPRTVSAIALGGAIGSLSRWQLAEILPSDFIALLLANLLGSICLGVLIQLNLTQIWQGFLQVGAMGSFTSLSAAIVLISLSLSMTEMLIALLTTFLVAPMALHFGKTLRISD